MGRFIGGKGGLSKLLACYRVDGVMPDCPQLASDYLPQKEKEKFRGENDYYDLSPVDLLAEYEQRLVIDWGKSTLMWHQKGSNPKPVVAIEASPKVTFCGYENVLLTYAELKDIVENEAGYESWRVALSSVNAIYLIVDQETGKQYVGSAYGKDGLFARWSCYVQTLHGNNKLMKELLCQYPERYTHFQFSILQILPKTVTDEEVIRLESLYKAKLMTIPFGMNAN